MKTLQDSGEKTRHLHGAWPVKTIEFRPEQPTSLTLLLHGYNERGLRIFRKLKRHLPQDTYIVAPNAPFPLPRVKSDRLDFGHAWYFFDKFKQTYEVDQSLAVGLIMDLLREVNPNHLPVTIIGFSQGGYLAPLIAYAYPHTKHVIGIGCEFRTKFFDQPPSFTLAGIHGSMDPLVNPDHALSEINLLKERGISVDWHFLEGVKHEINSEVGLIVSTLMRSYGK